MVCGTSACYLPAALGNCLKTIPLRLQRRSEGVNGMTLVSYEEA